MPRRPDPYELFQQTGGGDAYRVAMYEYEHVYPLAPWLRDSRGEPKDCKHANWSRWHTFSEGSRSYEGRWCQTCGVAQSREGK